MHSLGKHTMMRYDLALIALLLANVSAVQAADVMRGAVTAVPVAEVKLNGPLGERYAANTGYLQWRYRDLDRLLFPFEHRDQWQRVKDWDGEYIGKWLDAAVLTADGTQDAQMLAAVDQVAMRLRATQEPDGYLGTEMPETRLKPGWPVWMHWLAMKGLREHGQRRGDPASIQAFVRGADWVLRQYGPITDAKSVFYRGNGHLSVLDELVEAYAITGNRKYLEFGAAAVAHYPPFIKMRTEGRVAPMHSYSLMTFLGATVRLHQARGEREELRWLERVWEDIAAHHLFPTASVSTAEHFKEPPRDVLKGELQETCATVEWLIFTHRLYLATGDIRYAHMLERTVRNALLGAQSTDGMAWNYFTPLRQAKAWFAGPTDCCYFSGPRGIARLPGLIYHRDADGIRVDIFESSTAHFNVEGEAVKIAQKTDYSAGSSVELRFDMANPLSFALKLRIPEHVANARVRVTGETAISVDAGRYAELRRRWKPGDVIRVEFEPQAWLAELADGNVAISRGAEVLSLDLRDNPGVDLEAVRIPGLPVLERADPSNDRDHRVRYRCQLEIAGKPVALLLTPFAVAGNPTPGTTTGSARYRTAFSPTGRQ